LWPGISATSLNFLSYARLARFMNQRQPFYGLRSRCVAETDRTA
jgi:hypothetical protein